MTQETEDVVAVMLARLRRLPEQGNYATAMPRTVPVNPDGPEAADLIQSLSDRIVVLEELLTLARRFVDNAGYPLDPGVKLLQDRIDSSLIKEGGR